MIQEAAGKIKGNARACLITEPFFTIPHTMYTGYMTLYMIELGMTKSQVGMVSSLGLAAHLVFAVISSYVIDKMGRRTVTLIFDVIGWSMAQVVWAIARDIRYFVAAALINAFGRIVMNSFHCLMLEDSPMESRIYIFNFMQVAGLIAGFFAPLSAFLIRRYTLVPAMRGFFWFGTIFMTGMFFIRHLYLRETTVGKQKMRETRDVGVMEAIRTYIPVMRRIRKNRILLLALALRTLNFIQLTTRNTFLSVLVTERWGFPAGSMAIFQTVNAFVMLFVLLLVSPALANYTRRWPVVIGLAFHIAATGILLFAPAGASLPLLVLCSVLIAMGTSIATPYIEALSANAIDNEDRSLINAVASVILLSISSPFGYIGGVLSTIDTRLPFVMTLTIFAICLFLLRAIDTLSVKQEAAR